MFGVSEQRDIALYAAVLVIGGTDRERALDEARERLEGAKMAQHDPTGVEELLEENELPTPPTDRAGIAQMVAIAMELDPDAF
ncbi:hypothetical protein [Stenotrophomonas maltophilia]|uniref:hypothetical protein n=1 Tax=Stenotrophomonas maltophilia TaxID=40324 RepID=UPI003BF7C6C3